MIHQFFLLPRMINSIDQQKSMQPHRQTDRQIAKISCVHIQKSTVHLIISYRIEIQQFIEFHIVLDIIYIYIILSLQYIFKFMNSSYSFLVCQKTQQIHLTTPPFAPRSRHPRHRRLSEEATELGARCAGKSQDWAGKTMEKTSFPSKSMIEIRGFRWKITGNPTSSNHDWHQILHRLTRGVFEKIGIILLFVRKTMLMSHG